MSALVARLRRLRLARAIEYQRSQGYTIDETTLHRRWGWGIGQEPWGLGATLTRLDMKRVRWGRGA